MTPAAMLAVSLPGLDTAILVGYLAAVVGFGCWFVRKTRTPEDFMVAGRSMPGWAVGLSILGAFVSSISLIALPGKAFGGNWNAYCFTLSLPIALIIAVRFFAPFYRRTGEVSAYQHLERRFGPWARTYAVVCYLLTMIARMGATLYLLAVALAPMLGWPLWVIIVLAGGLVTVYTVVGGTEAVIWTDAVHNIVLIVGVVVCVIIQLFGMPEGPGQVFRIAAEHHKFSLGDTGPSPAAPTVWVVLVYGLFVNLQNFGVDQNYVQRYITARNDKAASVSLWLGGLSYVPLSALLLFIGTALFAFYAASPHLLPAATRARPDDVFPWFITHQLPPGMTGLVIAAIFAAAMNGFGLNIVSTITLCDLYQRYLRPRASERESMTFLYASTFVWGALATGVALWLWRINSKNLLDVWWELAGILSGGMLGLFLLGVLSKRATSGAAAAGVVAGVAVIVWMTASRWGWVPVALRSPFHPNLIIVFGTLTILGVGLAAAQFSRKPRAGTAYLAAPAPAPPVPASSTEAR